MEGSSTALVVVSSLWKPHQNKFQRNSLFPPKDITGEYTENGLLSWATFGSSKNGKHNLAFFKVKIPRGNDGRRGRDPREGIFSIFRVDC